MIGLDIEMPKCCDECPVWDGEWVMCNLTNERPYNETGVIYDPTNERGKNCPLVDLTDYHDCTACVYIDDPDDE